MKTRYFISIIIVAMMVIVGCSKKEDPNVTCRIIAPPDLHELSRGESVEVYVETSGNGRLQIKIDDYSLLDESIYNIESVPETYIYNLATGSLSEGTYLLKAIFTIYRGGGLGSSGRSYTATSQISLVISRNSFIDQRDGQNYFILEIGGQTWFGENLNYETNEIDDTDFEATNSWWLYNDDSINGDIYGRLYTWNVALNACPAGWHLPSDDEWKVLEMHLGMSQSEADRFGLRGTDEGEQLKGSMEWDNNGNGTNSSGFTALPGGYINNINDGFFDLGSKGYWWSSDKYSATRAWNRILYDSHDKIRRSKENKTKGYSVRCVKD